MIDRMSENRAKPSGKRMASQGAYPRQAPYSKEQENQMMIGGVN